jgi:putative DNA primase/helicase
MARVIEKHHPTVLIDEYDATFRADRGMAENLRGQLNSSFDRDGAKIGKCIPLPGGGWDERHFSTWTATWVAGIKHIPDTVKDRSIVIALRRKLPSEKVKRLRAKDGGDLDSLKRKIARWVSDNELELRRIDPQSPEALEAAGDRAADAWDPLFAIADVAGGEWPVRARDAALKLTGIGDVRDDADNEAALLADLKRIFEACDAYNPSGEQLKNNKQVAVEALGAIRRSESRGEQPDALCHVVGLGGEQIVNALATFDEREWLTSDGGKPMTAHQLANLLRPYGVTSQTLRCGAFVFRGYPRERLDEVFDRYLTSPPR